MKSVLAFALLMTSTSIALSAPLPQSKYSSAIQSETYPAAKSPDKAAVISWDFASKREVSFRFEQKNENRFSGLGGNSGSTQSSTTAGTLVVKSSGDHTGQLVLDKATMKTMMSVRGKPTETSQTLPQTVVTGVREDGTFASATSGHEALLRIMLPLPPKPLAVGATVDLPVSIPFSSLGLTGTAKGTARLVLVGYSTIGKRVCARLESDVALNELAVAKDVTGKRDFSGKGKSVLFFDQKDRMLVRGVMTLVVRTTVDTPVPAEKGGGSAPAPKATMTLTSDSLVRLSLSE